MKSAVILLSALVASAAQGQSHPTAGAVSRTEHVADFASLPTCGATSTFMQDRHVDDEDARYMCYDFGSGLEWTTVGSGSTLPFVLVDGTTFAQTTDGIQAALDTLPAGGGTIFLADGTYSPCAGTITIPADAVTVMSSPDAAIIDCSGGQPMPVFDMATRDLLTFSGFKVIGESGGGNAADIFWTSGETSDSVFDGMTIQDSDEDGIEFGTTSARNTIRSSTFLGNDRQAIRCGSGTRSVVKDSFFDSSGGQVIHCAAPGAMVSGNTITSSNFAIQAIGDGALIHDNDIIGKIDLRGDANVVSINRITPVVGGSGISVTSSDSNAITGNTIHGTSNHIGIDVTGSSTGNTFSSNVLRDLSVNVGWAAIRIGASTGENFFLGNTNLNNAFYILNNNVTVPQVFHTADNGVVDAAPGFTVSTAPGLADLAEIGGTSATVAFTGELVGPVLEVAENGGGIALEISNAGIVAHPRNIGDNPPATCTPGTIFTDLDAADDTNCVTALDNSICLCVSANTWVERS